MPPKPCPPGKILRSSYTAKRGNTEYKVESSCIKDRGNPGKTPPENIIPLNKDDGLSKYGYKNVTKTSTELRRNALKNAINGIKKEKKLNEHDAALKVMRRLNVIMILNKNTNITMSKLIERDRNWVGRNYLGVDYARK